MTESHDRRAFFKQLLRGAAQTAAEVGDAFKGAQEPLLQSEPEPDPWQMTWGTGLNDRPVEATAATRAATETDLRELAEEVGLGERVDDVLAHARTSLRITRGDYFARSHLGGLPDVPEGFEWPTSGDVELAFLAQIRLEEVAAAAPGPLPLPATGALLVFYDLERRPSGLQPGDGAGIRIVHLHADADDLHPAEGDHAALVEMPVAFSPEVTLPAESAGLPESLVLNVEELDRWQRLRERLAERQGVEVEDRAVDWHALHRLLGHPDTTAEGMQLEAQLAFNGIDLNTGERYFNPAVSDLERGAEQWRLLVQISADDELALQLGFPVGRLFVWIREDDLAYGRFGDVWAFVR